MWVLAWVACTPPPPSDAVRLRDALVHADISACVALVDVSLRDGCVSDVAGMGTDAAACDGVTTQPWIDECHFMVAERRYAGGDEPGARAECARAGRYSQKCVQHLWKQDREGAFVSGDRAQDIVEIRAAYAQLLADIPEGEQRERREWRAKSGRPVMNYYFRHVRVIDPTVCDEMPELADTDCVVWAREILAERLDRELEPALKRESFCRLAGTSGDRFAHDGTVGVALGWTPDLRTWPAIEEQIDKCP